MSDMSALDWAMSASDDPNVRAKLFIAVERGRSEGEAEGRKAGMLRAAEICREQTKRGIDFFNAEAYAKAIEQEANGG